MDDEWFSRIERAGKLITVQPPFRQIPLTPDPYEFNILNGTTPVLITDPSSQGHVGGWIEWIGNESPATYESTTRSAHATLYAYIPNDQRSYYSFENSVLGWHMTSDDFRSIKRTNPIQHPRKRNLWAYKVSQAKGLQFQGRVDALEVDKNIVQMADYDRMLVAVDFQPIRYNVGLDNSKEILHTDTETGNEYPLECYRYVEGDIKTNITDVSIQTGQFVFAEGPDPPNGRPFPGELNFMEVRTVFTLRWRCVPLDFVCDMTNYAFPMSYPWKLNSAGGKVNSKPFMGYYPGTLLLLEHEIDIYPSGTLYLERDTRSKDRNEDRSFMMCDVTLTLVHFDPPHYSEKNRGHNIKPWRRDTSSADVQPDTVEDWEFWKPDWIPPWAKKKPNTPIKAKEPQMLYYLVKFVKVEGGVSTVTETKIYGEYDFNDIFTHWSVV